MIWLAKQDPFTFHLIFHKIRSPGKNFEKVIKVFNSLVNKHIEKTVILIFDSSKKCFFLIFRTILNFERKLIIVWNIFFSTFFVSFKTRFVTTTNKKTKTKTQKPKPLNLNATTTFVKILKKQEMFLKI